MESATLSKDKGTRLFKAAWEEREAQFQSDFAQETHALHRKIASLQTELSEAHSKIAVLEQTREQFQGKIQELEGQNSHFERLRSRLLETLDANPTNGYTFSFKPIIEAPTVHRLPSPFTRSSEQSSPVQKSVSGKQFFAEAKAKLPFEQFQKFLIFVKKINDKTLSRAKAIKEVREVFGQQTDLYNDFVKLMSKSTYNS